MICNNCNNPMEKDVSTFEYDTLFLCKTCKVSVEFFDHKLATVNVNLNGINFCFNLYNKSYYYKYGVFGFNKIPFIGFPEINNNIIYMKEYINKLNNLMVLL